MHIINHKNLADAKDLLNVLAVLSILDIMMLPDEDEWLCVNQKTSENPLAYEINNGSGDNMFLSHNIVY